MRSFVITADEYFDPTATVSVPFQANKIITSAQCTVHTTTITFFFYFHLPITFGFPSNENDRDDVTSVMSPSQLRKRRKYHEMLLIEYDKTSKHHVMLLTEYDKTSCDVTD